MEYLFLSEPYWIKIKGKYIKRKWWHVIEKIEFDKDVGEICITGNNVVTGDFHYQWFKKLPKLKVEKTTCHLQS